MRQLKGYQPLCIIKNKVLLYKKGKLFLYDEKTDSYQVVLKLKSGFFNKIKESLRLSSRLFRMGVRNALPISENEVLLTFDKALFHVSLSDKKVTKLIKMKKGFSNPLNLCAPLKGTKYIALFGDYGNNADRQSVSIYGVDESLSIKKVYTFPPKTIRHIHNIICDELNNGYYVFTGDNEPKAGIYWADADFNIMKPIYIGNQKARAVCGFMTERGLLYATDSVSQKNYIYLLTINNNQPSIQEITPINGSCIYATRYSTGYVFSTTVESEESNGNKIFSLLSTKRGKGILSDDVHLIYVSSQLKAKIIGVYKKDKLPYKLFQYGVIRFPSGLENYNKLIINPCAVRGVDGNTVFLNFKDKDIEG